MPAEGWGAQGRAAWQRWPCCAGLSGMLPAEVRARFQLPVGTTRPDGHPWSPGRRGLFAGAAVALGCKQVPALSPCRERVSLRPGAAWLGLGKGAGICSRRAQQRVRDTTARLSFCLMLILLKIAGRGCPVVVYGCFAEGFVNFWSCTCLYKYIYTCTHIHIYVNVYMYVYVAVHVINTSPYLDKTPPGCRAGLADNTVV